MPFHLEPATSADAAAVFALKRAVATPGLWVARRIAMEYPAQVIRLNAYDADAGAGAFYATCGFREVGRVIYRKNPLVYFETLI
jgi:hypothetical protein